MKAYLLIISLLFSTFISAQQADFEANTTEICAGTSVAFTDLSTGLVSDWSWSFGDGDSSVLQNPIHIYSSSDTFTVSLTINNGVSTQTKTQYIVVHPKPEADFSVSAPLGCDLPHQVTYSNTSQNTDSLIWLLDDTLSSGVASPSYTFENEGVFPVTLIALNDFGCLDTFTQDSAVQILELQATFAFDLSSGCKPLAVNFSDNTPLLSADAISTVSWDFGNGLTSNNNTDNSTYADTGLYDVTYSIQTALGCTDTVFANDFIKVGEPIVADFSVDQTTGCHPLTVNFSDLSDTKANGWLWDFGDGNTSSTQTPTHTYTDTGFFEVTLTSIFHGCSSNQVIKSDLVYVKPAKPIFFVDSIINCEAPYQVMFTDSSQGAEKWTYKFGDGNQQVFNSAPANTSHTYLSEGLFKAWLIVENFTTGCMDSTSVDIKVSDLQPGFRVDTTEFCQSDFGMFTDTSNTIFGVEQVYWTFDALAIDSGLTASYNFNDSLGVFDVSISVTDNLGCTRTLSKSDYITILERPVAEFSTDVLGGCLPLTVGFTDASSGVLGLNTWIYNYGDGSVLDTVQFSNYQYTSVGTYQASLTVIDDNGCSDTHIINPAIAVTFPLPDFTLDSMLCARSSYTIENTSAGADLSYQWDFNNDSIATQTSPEFNANFLSDTTYQITLIATDSNGCVDSVKREIFISSPFAQISVLNNFSDCPPLQSSFTVNMISANADLISITPGDGSNDFQNVSLTPFTYEHTYLSAGNFDVTLTVTDTVGCSYVNVLEDTILVEGLGLNATATLTPNTCAQGYSFSATANDPSYTFTWFTNNSGAYDSLPGAEVSYLFLDSGSYTPSVLVEDLVNGCSELLVLTPIQITPSNFSVTINTTDTLYQTLNPIDFSSNSGAQPTTSWLWDFGDGSLLDSTGSMVQHAYQSEGNYWVTLTASDAQGCQALDSLQIYVASSNGRVSNVFSPNGDGINDVLTLVNEDMKAVNFEIYNRWGSLIFSNEFTSEIIEWYGYDFAGTKVPTGTYYYVLELTPQMGEMIQKTGYITVFSE